jgi:hypothetical protein
LGWRAPGCRPLFSRAPARPAARGLRRLDHYGRLPYEIVAIGWRAAIKASGHGDVEELTSAARAVQTHLEATVVDHDAAALAFLLEGLSPFARFVGDNPLRLLVATGVLKSEEIADYVDEQTRRTSPPPA